MNTNNNNNIQNQKNKLNNNNIPTNIIIIGGGIVGCSTAYYLTKLYKDQVNVTLIEKYKIAGCASGKAGGFLAGNWGDDETNQLHQKGFQLHEQLAKELKLKSYRKIQTLSYAYNNNKKRKKKQNIIDKNNTIRPSWMQNEPADVSMMDTDIAQVTPYELTTNLMNHAIQNGAKLIIGNVIGIENDEEENNNNSSSPPANDNQEEANGNKQQYNVSHVILEENNRKLKCDKVIITLGPWSVLAEDWFNDYSSLKVPMEGIRSSSIVLYNQQEEEDNVASNEEQQPYAIFCNEDERTNTHLEIYPRPDHSIYMCGLGGSEHCNKKRIIELIPESVKPDETRIRAALKCFHNMSGRNIQDDEVSKNKIETNCCMRPCPQDGKPMMGMIPNYNNAYICCGHNCWGILWGPISGLSMSELMMNGKSSSINLNTFTPKRFVKRRKRKGKGQQRGRHQVDIPKGEQW